MPVSALFTPVNWGDVPTWLATLGAFLAAAIAWRTFRHERRRDQDGELRAQANLVAAWLVSQETHWLNDRTLGIAIRNASELPVYRVDVHLYNLLECDDPDGRAAIGPDDQPISFSLSVLGPSDEPLFFRWPSDAEVSSYGELWLSFVDAAGREWRRTPRGVLEPGRKTYEGPTRKLGSLWHPEDWRYGVPREPEPRLPLEDPWAQEGEQYRA
jgi:hypothetical protein